MIKNGTFLLNSRKNALNSGEIKRKRCISVNSTQGVFNSKSIMFVNFFTSFEPKIGECHPIWSIFVVFSIVWFLHYLVKRPFLMRSCFCGIMLFLLNFSILIASNTFLAKKYQNWTSKIIEISQLLRKFATDLVYPD